MFTRKSSKFIIISSLFFISSLASAIDIVRWNHGQYINEDRRSYKSAVLIRALELTKPEYGDYQLVESDQHRVIMRAIQEVISGENINIFMAITSNEWEEHTLPIRIPIRRGLLNYRLLATTTDKKNDFSKLDYSTIKSKRAGLRRDWATTASLKQLDFNLLTGTTLDGLYKMLSIGRVDYIPRGINDIFDEISTLDTQLENVVIEPKIALYLQAPYYIFVSPKYPRIAKRLEAGLELMVQDSSLKSLFYNYFEKSIRQADIANRKIISIKNPNISSKTPLLRKELWFEHDDGLNILIPYIP